MLAKCSQFHLQKHMQVSWLTMMCLGIALQEYYRQRNFDLLSRPSTFRLLWVVCAMLLSMSFAGNLKASLVRREYETPTQTLMEMVDKDMTIHMLRSVHQYINMTRKLSRLHDRVACQAQKRDSIYQTG